MVTVTRNPIPGALAPCVRVGVGGRWSVEELQRTLISFLGSSGWQVLTRSAEGELNAPFAESQALGSPGGLPLAGLVELVPLGDGLSQVVGLPESEELDAVVISPLAESGPEANAMTARRYLARFVRQLRPGGATIFAADDPVSDIFSVIRLDCRRLGYTFEGDGNSWLSTCNTGVTESKRRETASIEAGPDLAGTNPAELTRLELAAMTVVQAFGLGVKDSSAAIGALVS